MITRIIHFCDFHIKTTEDHNEYLDPQKVVQAISSLPNADNYIIVVSGDIAFSGKPEEYAVLSPFMTYFFGKNGFTRIEKSIPFIYVPGNHDIDFLTSSLPQNYDTFKEHNDSTIDNPKTDIGAIQLQYINAMKAFFQFSEKGHCKWIDPIINNRIVTVDGHSIGFVLLNTAPYSLIGGTEIDKGSHRLTSDQITAISNATNAEINCLVMHHGIEWYSNADKNRLREIIANKYNVVMAGHEHNNVLENRVINLGDPCYYMQSAAFHDPSIDQNGFCVLDIDFDNAKKEAYCFIRQEDGVYIHEIPDATDLGINLPMGIHIRNDFLDDLKKDNDGVPYEDYYQFPTVEYTNYEENKNPERVVIETESDLTKFIIGKRHVSISGEQKGGKTLLSKRLFLHLIKMKKIPILLTQGITVMKPDRIVENSFSNQYNNKNQQFQRFLQIPKKDRIAIVDDADLLKEKSLDKLLCILDEQFGTIVLFHRSEFSVDIQRQVIDAIEKNDQKMTLGHFWYSSRKDLIIRVLKAYGYEGSTAVKEAAHINDLINSQIRLFQLNPDFIINFIRLYLQDSKLQVTSGKNAFSMVYETSIKNRIIEHCQIGSPDIAFNILRELAYKMHFEKNKEISNDEISQCIKKYEQDYRQTVKVRSFIDTAVESGILVENGNMYHFKDKTHQAYFVASAINQKAGDDTDLEYYDAEQNFNLLLKNLCFGINSDIVLFLSVITNNRRFINIIMDSAEAFFNEMEEMNFEKENIPLISKVDFRFNQTPSEKDKKRREIVISESERDTVDSDSLELVDDYDYNDDDLKSYTNQVLIALKLTDVLSKSLPAFCMNMKTNQQDRLVNLIYHTPNKLVFLLLKGINDEIDSFVNEVFADAQKKGRPVTKEAIETLVKQISAALVASAYLSISSVCTSKESIAALNAFPFIHESTNYEIMNLMMNARICDIKALKEKAIKLDKSVELPIEHSLIVLTVRDYYMRNAVPLHGDGEALATYFFGEQSKRQLLIENGTKISNKAS